MFNFFYNSNIFIWIEKLMNFINSIFFVLLLVALSFALIFSPPDYLQGDSVRIMYVHVPAAWIGLASFTSIAILSILNFIFKIKNLILITKSIAPIGFMFTCLAISYWIYMGTTHLGNLLGLGCKNNIDGYSSSFLFYFYNDS